MTKQANMIDLLSAGIRGASVRQKVIAGNIANAETPGFKRRVVEFEKALAKAMDRGDGLDGPVETKVQALAEGRTDATGNNVDLEVEIGELVQNGANYKAYMRILNNVYKQMETAMTVQ